MADEEEIVVFEDEHTADLVFQDLALNTQARNVPGRGQAQVAPRDIVHVRVTGAKASGFYPGVVTWRDLTAGAETWYDGDDVQVTPLNDSDEVLQSGKRNKGTVLGEKDGRQVVGVVVGGGLRYLRVTLTSTLAVGGSATATVRTPGWGGGGITVWDDRLFWSQTIVSGKQVH